MPLLGDAATPDFQTAHRRLLKCPGRVFAARPSQVHCAFHYETLPRCGKTREREPDSSGPSCCRAALFCRRHDMFRVTVSFQIFKYFASEEPYRVRILAQHSGISRHRAVLPCMAGGGRSDREKNLLGLCREL